MDRDDNDEAEIEAYKQKGTKILRRRDIENYLWDDEILEKLCNVENQSAKIVDIKQIKVDLLKDSVTNRKNPPDDIKSIGGQLYVQIKQLLSLTQRGNTKEAFCKAVLAQLITPDTQIYKELEEDIFGTT
jgi:hypothetical protein